MTTVADLVRVMHDIDVIKGRTCGACLFDWRACEMRPAGPRDGCDGWTPGKPVQRPDGSWHLTVPEPRQRPRERDGEPDGPEAA